MYDVFSLNCQVSGTGVLAEVSHKSGISRTSGKPWEIFTANFQFLGSNLMVNVEKEAAAKLEKGKVYMFTANIQMDGFDYVLRNFECKEVQQGGAKK